MTDQTPINLESASAAMPQIASRLLNTPLMLSRPKLEVLLSVLGPRLNLDVPKIDAASFARSGRERDYTVLDGGVAVIPVHGSLVHRGSWVDAMSGLSNYQLIQNRFMDALRDQDVSHIIMELDSPGGEVHGVFDLAELIYKHRGEKPTTAAINEQAYSACYLIGSACDRIVLPRTAGAGSIGVIAAHVDWSKANEMEGIKVTTVYAGDRKNDFNPNEALSDDAFEVLKAHVNETYDLFVETVARNRGMSTKDVRDTKAGLFYGKSATKSRLADKVQSFNETLAELVQQATKRGSARMNTDDKPTTLVSATEPDDQPNAPVAEPTPEGGDQAPVGDAPAAEGGAEASTPGADPVPAQPSATVIDFESRLKVARDEASAQAIAQQQLLAKQVTDLCTAMKVPHMAGALIADGKTLDSARAAIFEAKAKADADSSIVSAPDSGASAKPNHGWGDAFAKIATPKKK